MRNTLDRDSLNKRAKSFLGSQDLRNAQSPRRGRGKSKGSLKAPSPAGSLVALVLVLGIGFSIFLSGQRVPEALRAMQQSSAQSSPEELEARARLSAPALYKPSFPLDFLSSSSLIRDKKNGTLSVPSITDEFAAFGGATNARLLGQGLAEEQLFFTVDPELQSFAQKLIAETNAQAAAIVMMETKTGRILAITGSSKTLENPLLHANFPAASLFKIVSSAAALENSDVTPDTGLFFRGGTYTLNKYNYLPDKRRDARKMSLEEALAKSCNPAFARLALQHLTPELLTDYAGKFGFNNDLLFDLPLEMSKAEIPSDEYGLARSSAGFGQVAISPVHAAAFAAMLGNEGRLPRPALIETAASKEGDVFYQFEEASLPGGIEASTARKLLHMLEKTTTIGTSRKEFLRSGKPVLGNIRVAGKTGTLRGFSLPGIHNWFVGTAPVDKPEVSIATLLVYPNYVSTRASRLARKMFAEYFGTN